MVAFRAEDTSPGGPRVLSCGIGDDEAKEGWQAADVVCAGFSKLQSQTWG